MLVEFEAVDGVGHRIYNDLGTLLGVSDSVLVQNVVVVEEGMMRDIGVFGCVARGEVIAFWGLATNENAPEEEIAQLVQRNNWPPRLPDEPGFLVRGELYRGYKDKVCTAGLVFLRAGGIFIEDASSIPQQ